VLYQFFLDDDDDDDDANDVDDQLLQKPEAVVSMQQRELNK